MRNTCLVLFWLVMCFILGLIVAGGVVAEEFKNLDKALKHHKSTGRPLVVVLSGDWCSWCVKQKQELQSSKPKDFDWVVVDHNKAPQYKIKGKGIPQLSILKKGKHKTYVGYRKTADIRKLISK